MLMSIHHHHHHHHHFTNLNSSKIHISHHALVLLDKSTLLISQMHDSAFMENYSPFKSIRLIDILIASNITTESTLIPIKMCLANIYPMAFRHTLLIFPEHSQRAEKPAADNVHPSPTIGTSVLKNRMKHVRVYHRTIYIYIYIYILHEKWWTFTAIETIGKTLFGVFTVTILRARSLPTFVGCCQT